ncbi:hypothetical protein GLYMA_11G160693v4 [Glycine max]|nr:hypothetical protein GLYMA_11G160693v4 [Glycine max]KAH1115888.1 hypothetical protein GYH30_057163 [Glycine max]
MLGTQGAIQIKVRCSFFFIIISVVMLNDIIIFKNFLLSVSVLFCLNFFGLRLCDFGFMRSVRICSKE